MQLIIDKQLISYRLSGSGPLVVFLHGWGDDMNTFTNLENTLSKKYQVLLLDLPGFGGSSAPPEAWNLRNYSEIINRILIKLHFNQVFAFIGHSNGGAICIYGLGEELIVSKKLILIGSSGIRKNKKLMKTSLTALTKIGVIVTKPLPAKLKKKIKTKLYGAIGSDALVRPELIETFKKITKQDVSNQAKKIRIPVMLIYGYNDSSTPVEYGVLFNKMIKKSKLAIIEGAGHFVHQENETEILQLISDFLGDNNG
jgi:pimeloyl-ACP methyl ester carboxylesterase